MARRLGVNRATVTKACQPGRRLAPACRGTEINVLHPAARKWIAQREAQRPSEPPEAEPAPAPANDAGAPPIEVLPPGPDPDEPATSPVGNLMPWQASLDLSELEKPLTELTERYGSAEAFTGWVKARGALEQARKHEMLRLRVAGMLIARTTVVRMIDHVDAAFRILLSDAPRTIATRLGVADTAATAALIRDVISQQLTAAQSHMVASLEADDPMAPLMEAAE
jgi:hypothetical protein